MLMYRPGSFSVLNRFTVRVDGVQILQFINPISKFVTVSDMLLCL